MTLKLGEPGVLPILGILPTLTTRSCSGYPPCETVGRRAERRSKNNGPTESKGQTQSRQRGWLWVNRALPPTRRPGGPHGAAPSRAPKGLRVHPPLPRDVASTRSPSSACRTSPPPHHLPPLWATHSGVSH